MKFRIKIIITFLLFSVLTLLSSCKGQATSHNAQETINQQSSITSFGQAVSEIDKSIMHVLQDTKNNYWFGSKTNGVYRYDGKNIVHFTTRDGLCNNQIRGIQEDKEGTIYFDSGKCISKYNGQSFKTLTAIEDNDHDNNWKLGADDLWFKGEWSENGVYRYDGQSLYHLKFPKHNLAVEFYTKYPNASYSPYGIYSIYKDRKGNIWFGTSNIGICRYDGKTLSWMYEKHLTDIGEASFGIRSIIEDKEGYFWFCNTRYRYDIHPDISSRNGMHFINYNREKGMHKSGANNADATPYYMSIAEDDNGDLWMVTYDEGVWRYNGDELIQYPIKEGNQTILLFSIYKDIEGAIWLGTHEKGVYKFNGTTFEKFEP